jgi:plastocyanin
MKKILLLSFLISSFTAAFANVITVQVVDFQFKPSTVNAKVGDVIKWVWKQGTHTTTSLTIPSGALAWNKPIDVNHQVFKYKITKAGTYRYQCNIHASIMKGTINVTTALTAGLNSFSIDDAEATALLNWKTGSSKELAYFSVQRSTDGENFKEIGRISPNQLNQYKFTDNNNSPDKYVYYQIDMVDTKGNHELSEIQMFTQKNIKTTKLITSLSPNPISKPGHLMMQFNADNDGKMLVQLYNQAGAFIAQTEMAATKGLNNGHFHLGDLAPGTYYIVCTLGTSKEKHAIIVR